MMHALVMLHRWLGVATCLLFAMWFASGIVMHFVPYPALSEAERIAGMAPLDRGSLSHGPADAVAASRIAAATRVRLLQRIDGAVYVVSAGPAVKAVRAADLADGAVGSSQLALAIAKDYARRRGSGAPSAQVIALTAYDQWTFSAAFEAHRPLYRIAMNNERGAELYVSSATGEVVLETDRRQRLWNYLGSVPHWIYPTALRSHAAAWRRLVWWVSLLALIGAAAGALLGVLRIEIKRGQPLSLYRGWQAWHHGLGVCCMLFVLTWILSGWLSMDNGRLFSTGKPSTSEIAAVAGVPDWNARPGSEGRLDPRTVEVEWFAFAGRIYERERAAPGNKGAVIAGSPAEAAPPGSLLGPNEINSVAHHLARKCARAIMIGRDDRYLPASTDAPIFRVICGDLWFDIDATNGALLEKLDRSRRAYRWLYGALHTFDFPVLAAYPTLRTSLIVALCGFGFAFSLTGIVIAARRLLSCFARSAGIGA